MIWFICIHLIWGFYFFWGGAASSISCSFWQLAVAKPGSVPKNSTCWANRDQSSYILSNPHTDEEYKSQILPIQNVLKLPGTHWMRFATMALKWALISLRISASLSFSTSKCSRVRSMYSRNRAPMARLSRSRAPFVLHGETANRWIDVLYEHMLTCKSKSNIFFFDPMTFWALPVTDDACISQQLEDAQKLESQQVSPFTTLLVLWNNH